MTPSNRVYTETYIVLEKFNLLKDLPNNLQELIKANYDNYINFTYNDSLPLEYQALSKDTRIYLTYLYIKYFCKSSDERKQYQLIIAENTKRAEINQIKLEEEKKKEYNPDNLFKKAIEQENRKIKKEENQKILIEYKASIFTKFKNFIFRILHN